MENYKIQITLRPFIDLPTGLKDIIMVFLSCMNMIHCELWNLLKLYRNKLKIKLQFASFDESVKPEDSTKTGFKQGNVLNVESDSFEF